MDTKDLKDLFEKLDSHHRDLTDKINAVDKTLVKQHEQLTYHIKRTDLLEAEVRDRTMANFNAIKSIKADTKPIHTHVDRVQFFFKMVKWVGLPLIFTGIGLILRAYIGG